MSVLMRCSAALRQRSPIGLLPMAIKRSFSSELEDEIARFNEIFVGNRKWIAKRGPDFFDRTSSTQSPRYLFIGCADSRVPSQSITNMDTGELFVHRNIANMVVGTDINMLSVLEFAVENLKVKHIIVCGHYGCGGVHAALNKHDSGALSSWLCNIRDVHRLHIAELSGIKDPVAKERRLVELNVREQCINLFKTGIVQRSLHTSRFPRIHGLVYDLSDGVLKNIDINFNSYRKKYGSVYELYDDDDPEY